MEHVPPPPRGRDLLIVGLAGGVGTAFILSALIMNITSGLHPAWMAVQILVGLGICGISAWRGAAYLLTRAKRNAWWDGATSIDEPMADVVPISPRPRDDLLSTANLPARTRES